MSQPMGWISLVGILPILVVGLALWFSARTRRGVLFGVSVPLDFADGPEAKSLIATYRSRVLRLTIVAAASRIPVVIARLPWLTFVTIPLLIIGGMVMLQLARRKVKPHQISAPIERKAGIDADAGSGWFAGIAMALVPLACTWLYLRRHWDSVPARFPIHWSFNGTANGWATRTAPGVATPLLIGAVIVLLMLGIALFMRLAPAVERQRGTRVILPILMALSWLFSLLFSWIALTPLRPAFNPSQMIIPIVIVPVCVLGIVVWMISRLMGTQGTAAYDGTPDVMWRAGGTVYYNPADAAVIVPKRLGWGWTLNFARPAAWCYLGIILVVALTLGGLPFLLK